MQLEFDRAARLLHEEQEGARAIWESFGVVEQLCAMRERRNGGVVGHDSKARRSFDAEAEGRRECHLHTSLRDGDRRRFISQQQGEAQSHV